VPGIAALVGLPDWGPSDPPAPTPAIATPVAGGRTDGDDRRDGAMGVPAHISGFRTQSSA